MKLDDRSEGGFIRCILILLSLRLRLHECSLLSCTLHQSGRDSCAGSIRDRQLNWRAETYCGMVRAGLSVSHADLEIGNFFSTPKRRAVSGRSIYTSVRVGG